MSGLRQLLIAVVPALVAAGGIYLVLQVRLDQLRSNTVEALASESRLQAQISELEQRVVRLSANATASGGGANLKMMPDESGQPTVELVEVFSFDRNHAFCRVDTNPKPFVMPTFKMGNVSIPANGFFMAMSTTSIDDFQVKTEPDGKRTATFKGNLACSTEVGTAAVTLGSRTAVEHARYEVAAIDAGVGGGKAGDTFAFTVFFDEGAAPVNYSIFGPKFTFTGRMVDGEITIVDPNALGP